MGNIPIATPTETYGPSKSDPNAPPGPSPIPLRSGPYPAGTRPDHVYFRTNAPVNPEVRAAYENATTPFETDRLNEALLAKRLGLSPLGDPVPFSAYLIGRIANDTNYQTQFNLDSDRGYGYLTWDWIRGGDSEHENGGMHTYVPPVVKPAGDVRWIPQTNSLNDIGATPMQLTYVDLPPQINSPVGPRVAKKVSSKVNRNAATEKKVSK